MIHPEKNLKTISVNLGPVFPVFI